MQLCFITPVSLINFLEQHVSVCFRRCPDLIQSERTTSFHQTWALTSAEWRCSGHHAAWWGGWLPPDSRAHAAAAVSPACPSLSACPPAPPAKRSPPHAAVGREGWTPETRNQSSHMHKTEQWGTPHRSDAQWVTWQTCVGVARAREGEKTRGVCKTCHPTPLPSSQQRELTETNAYNTVTMATRLPLRV